MIYAIALAMFASHATAEPEWNGGPPLCFEMSVHTVFKTTIGWDSSTTAGVIVPLTYADADKIYSPTTEPGALITATVNKAIWQWNGGQGTPTEFDLSYSLSTYANVDDQNEYNSFGIIVDPDCPPDADSNNGGISIVTNTALWDAGTSTAGGRVASGRFRTVVEDAECIAVFMFTEARSDVTTVYTTGLSFYMRQISTATKPCQ